jgi:hypothetical protein
MAGLARNPDFEIKKILQCLKKNGFDFGGIEYSDEAHGFMNAYFNKDVEFDDIDGNDVNDSHMIIKVEFDSRMDPEHSYYNEENEYVPDIERGGDFISNLFNELAGGKRKTKKINLDEKIKKIKKINLKEIN